MISSVSSNRIPAQQTDFSQRISAVPTNDQNQDVVTDPALKREESKLMANQKTGEMSASDLIIIGELKQRDVEVRAHEAAHLAVAGGIATSSASFEYQQGPDGVQYAIGGEVNISTSAVSGDPAATLRKANTIRRAALAPAQPSGPDMQVAAAATAMASMAQMALLQKIQNLQNSTNHRQGSQINLSV
jgi:hypothetical protein